MAPQTKSTPAYPHHRRGPRRVSLQDDEDSRGSSSSSSSASASGSGSDSESGGESKQLLRTWLLRVVREQRVPGLVWMDKEQTLLNIPWTHGSRQGFSMDKDSCLFRMWAVHSRRYVEGRDAPDPKRWKANFRCALNSLKDVKEEPTMSQKKGCGAFKVYRFEEEQPKKSLQKIKDQSVKTHTKASKRVKLNNEKAKKLQQSISEQNRRLMGEPQGRLIGVRRIRVTHAVRDKSCSPPPAAPVRRRNSLLLNRDSHEPAQRNPVVISIPTTLDLPSFSSLTPTTTSTSPLRASPPPAELTGRQERGMGQAGAACHVQHMPSTPSTLSPTTSIPTFVEDDCEDFGTSFVLHDDRLISGECTEAGLAGAKLQNELWEDEQEPMCDYNQTGSYPTETMCTTSPGDEEILRIDPKELEMDVCIETDGTDNNYIINDYKGIL